MKASKRTIAILHYVRKLGTIALTILTPLIILITRVELFSITETHEVEKKLNINIFIIVIILILGIMFFKKIKNILTNIDTIKDTEDGYKGSIFRRILLTIVYLIIPVLILYSGYLLVEQLSGWLQEISKLIDTTVATTTDQVIDIVIKYITDTVEFYFKIFTDCLFSLIGGLILYVWLKPYSEAYKIDKDLTNDIRKEKRRIKLGE